MFTQAQLHSAGERMRQLINQARANPSATAAGFGIDLNEGLPAGTISPDPKVPLNPNSALLNSIDGHLNVWLGQFRDPDNRNPHTGLGDGSPQTRAQAVHYPNPQSVGENVDWNRNSAPFDLMAMVDQVFQALFVDSKTNGRGHRLNILNPNYRDIGSSAASGTVPASSPQGAGENLLLFGEDFGIPSFG
jgi:hypothetical protein